MRLARSLPYLGCSLAVGVFSGFSNFILPLWLFPILGSYWLVSLMATTRGFLGSIVSPLAGAWSDRVWAGWLGRRRIFILVGGLTTAALMALTPHVARWTLHVGSDPSPSIAGVLPIVLALLTTTITFNLMDDIHKAMLAELTVEPTRSRLSSFSVVTEMAGQVSIVALGYTIGTALGGNGVPYALFAVASALIALGVAITVLCIREPGPAVWRAEHAKEAAVVGEKVTWHSELRLYSSAVMLGAVVFFYWFGVNSLMPLLAMLHPLPIGVSEAEVPPLASLLLLSTTVMAIPMGFIGARIGKRRVLGFGYADIAFGALMGLLITTWEQLAVLLLLAGVGNAASLVLTIPLLADLVPRHHMGVATGMLAAAIGISAPVSSHVAAKVADSFGLRATYLLMLVSVMIALAMLTRVRLPATTTTPASGRAGTPAT